MWIPRGTHGMERGGIGTQWTRSGEFEATMIRMTLDPPLAAPVDPEDTMNKLTASARALARSVAEGTRSAHFGPEAIEIEIAHPVENPATLEPLLDRMARLAQVLRGGDEAGP